ncbi:MAG: histidine kinase dimerization/phosphoacceptor domain-containing protein, partial [Herbiconiux sp.]|nr:histidine kinase dimerization/phosphoacceptor domain-containing protein [Herbiconiux sp.]
MAPNLRRLRPFAEPLAGAVFLLVWLQAEAGRGHPLGFWVVLAAATAAIALSRLVPPAALALTAAVPLLQLAGLLTPPASTTWPVAFAALAVAFGAGHAPSARVRWAGLGVGAGSAVLVAVTLVPGGGWVSWTGFGQTLLARGPVELQWTILLAGLGFGAYALCWLLGVALRLGARRRAERELLARTESDLAVADAELRSATERDALAQEVHDVLAHSLAVVVAVADGTRYLRDARPEEPPARTDDALREIAGTARSALVDLR